MSDKPTSGQKDVSLLSDEELNAGVATILGWQIIDGFLCHNGSRVVPSAGSTKLNALVMGAANVPDYCHDLNAIHEAEKVLSNCQFDTFSLKLRNTAINTTHGVNQIERAYLTATARQRAEAFVLTMK